MTLSRRTKKDDFNEGHGNSASWMVTFADLIMLLLTFFVMLLSMKAMDRKDTREMFDMFIESEGINDHGGYQEEHATPDSTIRGTRKRALYITSNAVLKKILKEDYENLREYYEVKEDERGLILSVDSEQLFEPGSSELSQRAKSILDLAGTLFSRSSNDIIIEGHTDNNPTGGVKYASNWELSAYRAISVHSYILMTTDMDKNRLAPGGYGDSRPLASNDSNEGRAKNRRVEFIIRK